MTALTLSGLPPGAVAGPPPFRPGCPGRLGIGVDLSASYCRVARWRVFDPRQAAKAGTRTWTERQPTLFDQGCGR